MCAGGKSITMTPMKDRLIKALQRQPVDRTPVWIMRQAGRYLPEYREARAKVPDFLTFCKTPELACEVTLQPLRRFPLDAAIIFSDILTIPAAMGMNLQFVTGEGPVFLDPIREPKDLERLILPDVEKDLGYVMQAIRLVVRELNGKVPLIGFAGSPWTVACYMVEGSGSKTFQTIRSLCYQSPNFIHDLLQRLTQVTIDYLNAQVEAGAEVIMLFDTWGGLLNTESYENFSLYYMRIISQQLKKTVNGKRIPVIFFTKGGAQWLEMIASQDCDAIGLDWTINIRHARERVGEKVALQGNLDPAILFSNPKVVKEAVKKILDDFGSYSGHVFNLGHGIDQYTPVENVEAIFEALTETVGGSD